MIRDVTLWKFSRKEQTDERKLRNIENQVSKANNEPFGIINVVVGRLRVLKGRNKHGIESSVHVLLVKNEAWSKTILTFGPEDKKITIPHNDPLVSVKLNRYKVRKVLIDTGSSVNLITWDVSNKLWIRMN